jgi:VIT1/CCC1 family predicted Fe2+/Mn2+ transporter
LGYFGYDYWSMLHRRHHHIPSGPDNFLSVLEGLEGGFAIFTGIVAGLSFHTMDRRLLLVTGGISMLINGFNSAAVRYSSQHYMDELDGREKRNKIKNYFLPAAVEFLVYTIVSLAILLPLALLPSILYGVLFCSVLTVAVLFAAGWYRGWLLRTHPLKDGFEVAMLGAAIIAVGAIAGYLIS